MDRFDFVPGTVLAASLAWEEESDRIATAARNVAAVTTSGFGTGVIDAVSAFCETWSEYTTATAETATAMSETLASAVTAYNETDYQAQDAFIAWLEAAQ